MLHTFNNPSLELWTQLTQRPRKDYSALLQQIAGICQMVEKDGDAALASLTQKFDGVEVDQLKVSDMVIEQSVQAVPEELRYAIQKAAENIRRFHSAQIQTKEIIETMPGVKCWREAKPIDTVGLYIPGGTAPLFSTVLMLGIPADIAGCNNRIICTPPSKDGGVHPAILYAAKIAGITEIFLVGGAQAIAAMAYGTASIPRCYKIFGPGNQYVTAAKMYVQQQGIAIDLPAGPSEVLVYLDSTSHPSFAAADLLSQAEHGVDSQVVLVSTDAEKMQQTLQALEEQIIKLPRREMAEKAIENSKAIFFDQEETAVQFINRYAAEHLILLSDSAERLSKNINNAGSVFLGHYSPESVGDYASGTNHTLPTNGYAAAYSGVSLDSFVKKITYQSLSANGLMNIGGIVESMAEHEELQAHKNAVSIRKAQLAANGY